jgi:signal transduction histidine kinase
MNTIQRDRARTMAGPVPAVAWGRWQRAARFVLRVGGRALVESLYLLTAPVTAAAGLLLVLGGLCAAAAAGLLLPGRRRIVPWALAPVRWAADVERWRIAVVRSPSTMLWGTGPGGLWRAGRRPGPEKVSPASDPGLWLGVVHAVAVVPVALVTAVATGVWWFVSLGAATNERNHGTYAGRLQPMTLSVGSAQSHIAISLGLTSQSTRLAFGTVAGLLLLAALPLMTRACVAIQAGLGQALLSDQSALHRRISGLEQERDTARAQTVAAVTAEATALRRLERDIHDGPQQRLVRLAMELGRAQHHLGTRPEAVREALADAIAQTQEALEELRALSRGIAPPVLVDRGLRAALTALAARSTVPAELDVPPLDHRLNTAVETAAYFVVAEALTNVAKHSHAHQATIGLRQDGGTLRVWVTDDGVGGAALGKGHGLQGLDSRLHAAGGELQVTSPGGGPTTITAELPCR